MSEKEKDTAVTQETSGELSSSSLINRRRGLLEEFEFDALNPNTSGSTSIPLSTSPVVIASLTDEDVLTICDECNRVWLTCTVGWEAIANVPDTNKVDVLFKILRGTRHHHQGSTLIFSCRQSANAAEENFQTTTFTHVDLPLAKVVVNPCEDDGICHSTPTVPYIVTAELPLGGQAKVIGPITFTGAEIEQNN